MNTLASNKKAVLFKTFAFAKNAGKNTERQTHCIFTISTKFVIISTILLLSSVITIAQERPVLLKDSLKRFVFKTDTIFENQLVTDRAFNLFLQKKSSYYLTGASEISLSKLYATYSSDNDKFNFGVNFKGEDNEKKLKWLFTPLFESDIKKNFTTFYKKGEWQSDIRLGGKISFFFSGSVNYDGMDLDSDQETAMIVIRNQELARILDKISKDALLRTDETESFDNLLKKSLDELMIVAQKRSLSTDQQVATVGKNTIEYLEVLLKKFKGFQSTIDKLSAQYDGTDPGKNEPPTTVEKSKQALLDSISAVKNQRLAYLNTLALTLGESDDELLDSYKSQIANAEVNALYKKGSYNCFQNIWISTWGFIPLSQRRTFTAINNSQSFESRKMKLWEYNLQLNGIFEKNNSHSIYIALGWKIFNNNSAIADLMTSVDYYQYSQFPQTNLTQGNLAVLDNNKAYIGNFKEFVTNNVNFLFVVSLANTLASGKERFCTPGFSFFAEKNFGEFSATNLRFGVPLRFSGKSTPINIEPQVKLNDITNYSGKTDFKLQPTIGVNVGLPFSALFK